LRNVVSPPCPKIVIVWMPLVTDRYFTGLYLSDVIESGAGVRRLR